MQNIPNLRSRQAPSTVLNIATIHLRTSCPQQRSQGDRIYCQPARANRPIPQCTPPYGTWRSSKKQAYGFRRLASLHAQQQVHRDSTPSRTSSCLQTTDYRIREHAYLLLLAYRLHSCSIQNPSHAQNGLGVLQSQSNLPLWLKTPPFRRSGSM